MFNGFHGVLYREIHVFAKKARKQVLASSLSPLLFLIAFGWGFGKDVTMNGLPYISFLIPGLLTMATLNQSYGISQEININRFYFHVFDEYLIAPISHVEIIIGEAFYGVFRGCISMMLIFLYAFLFEVELILHPVFFPAIFIHMFLFSLLGVTMAMIVQDHGSQASVNTFVITPMVFLCGTFFPVDKLPYAFKVIVHCWPLTYSTKVIRASLTGGEINYPYFGLIAAFAVLFFLTALWALRKVEA